jgi:hypothetical protein
MGFLLRGTRTKRMPQAPRNIQAPIRYVYIGVYPDKTLAC